MIRQIIVYLAVFLLTFYSFFLYDDEILAAMLVVEMVYFVLSMLWLHYIKDKVHIKLETIIPIAEKNQEIPITLTVRNQSKLSNVSIKAVLKVENSFTGEKQRLKCVGTVSSELGITSILKAERCGNLKVSVEKCWIYDMLCILKRPYNMEKRQLGKESQIVGILPQCHLIPVEITRKTREFIADAEEYSDRESGDDPSEIYQIREYREKDSLHDIHWKLSAKADELLVKEHGRPLGCVVLVWLDLFLEDQGKKHVPDTLLEAAASLSMSLLEAECVHMVAWYEVENRKIQKKRISKEEHIYELLVRLLYTKPYTECVDDMFDETFRGTSFSSIVKITARGQVLVNDEEKLVLPEKGDDVSWDKMYFIL